MRRALITGVSGFVGPYLVKHLVNNGFEVFGVDRSGKKVEGCAVERCDVTDYDAVAAVVKQAQPSFIFHLAGQSSVARSWKEPGLTRKINVGGTRNLLDAVAAAGISPEVLIVSSAEVYGIAKKFPTAENHPLQPVGPYGESRVEQEKVALGYFRKGMRVIITRSFNHTGPGQPSEFVCSDFAKQIADIEKGKQQPVVRVGDLKIKRDFTDVRDVVNAYLLLLEKGRAGEAYNVCSGRALAIGEILDKLVKISRLDARVVHEKSRISETVVPVLHGDNSKIGAATGWKPVIDFDDTLSALLDYWRKSIA
ncbi:GDP-mannose 4,6-dehydratase [Candidatus Woesearchaeota archaeon]|nr:GDP-mannose 4,6-dehydratase [Candidatus Woesearchaeota archaeon]